MTYQTYWRQSRVTRKGCFETPEHHWKRIPTITACKNYSATAHLVAINNVCRVYIDTSSSNQWYVQTAEHCGVVISLWNIKTHVFAFKQVMWYFNLFLKGENTCILLVKIIIVCVFDCKHHSMISCKFTCIGSSSLCKDAETVMHLGLDFHSFTFLGCNCNCKCLWKFFRRMYLLIFCAPIP